jgi:hypothetical protein
MKVFSWIMVVIITIITAFGFIVVIGVGLMDAIESKT